MTLRPLDLANLIFPGAPAVNPHNPDIIVLAKSRMDVQKDTYRSKLILLNLKTGKEQELEKKESDEVYYDHNPRWSPDGNKIAFLRRSEGIDEVWLYEMLTGNEYTITPHTNVKEYVWSPKGDKIAFVSRVQVIDNTFFPVQRIRYKLDGEGITIGYNHIFLVETNTFAMAQISTAESDHSCPCFNSNGELLIYVIEYPLGDDLLKRPYIELFDFSQGISRTWDPLTGSISALICEGQNLFYGVGKKTTEHSAELDKIFALREGQPAFWLPVQIDMTIGYYVASDAKRTGLNPIVISSWDNKRIVFAGTTAGKQSIFILEIESLEVIELPLTSNVLAFDLVICDEEGCQVIFLADSINQPGEIYQAVWDYVNPVKIEQITQLNDLTIAGWPKAETREFKTVTADGIETQGWLMQNLKNNHVEHQGVIMILHGGPYLSFGQAFYFDFLYLSSLGYKVVFCNPRGSAGYGQNFSNAILGEWGRGDVRDILGFLNSVCQECQLNEPIFVMGGSYGGYLVNWLVSHDNRFQGAIAERALCNLYSKIGNSDLGFIDNRAQLCWADLWDDDEEIIMERSPIRYANQVNTPVLILHGEKDQRVPIEQAEQWFNALRRLGKKVEFIRFPDASHTMAAQGRPKQRLARLSIISDWLKLNS